MKPPLNIEISRDWSEKLPATTVKQLEPNLSAINATHKQVINGLRALGAKSAGGIVIQSVMLETV
jgi:hypothetical protein